MKKLQLEDLADYFVRASQLLDAGQDKQAYRLFLHAAEHGHAHSQHNVALLLEAGQGVKMDKLAAARWYVRSWRRDPQPSTAENLAMLYGDLGNWERKRFWTARAKGFAE